MDQSIQLGVLLREDSSGGIPLFNPLSLETGRTAVVSRRSPKTFLKNCLSLESPKNKMILMIFDVSIWLNNSI